MDTEAKRVSKGEGKSIHMSREHAQELARRVGAEMDRLRGAAAVASHSGGECSEWADDACSGEGDCVASGGEPPERWGLCGNGHTVLELEV